MLKEDLRQFDLPDEAGIYVFRGPKREILYIGKATVLKDRVRSYFSKDLAEARSPAIVKMVAEAQSITWQATDSVLEALILEANLIKQHQPPYNVQSRDNKSFNYLVIT
jgi:excinuclease ABC subunit C